MTLTADALWLNSFFSGYDAGILGIAHKLAEVAGSVLTPLNRLVTLLGEKGLLFILLGLVLMLFPRLRRTGFCIFCAVGFGALITNVVVKDLVARPRPFEMEDLYRQWWQFVGAPPESGFSFPSGHVTAAAAGVTALCLTRSRRWVLPGAIWVLMMMFSRNYLMAHYPSDVLFALFIGIFAGFLAYALTYLVFRFLEKHSGEGKVYDILLESGLDRFPSLSGLKAREETETDARAARPAPVRDDRGRSSERNQKTASHSASVSSRGSSRSGNSYQGKH